MRRTNEEPVQGRMPKELEPVAEFLGEFFSGIRTFSVVMVVLGLLAVAAGTLLIAFAKNDEGLAGGILIMAPFLIPLFVGLSRLLSLRRVEDWKPYRAAVLNHAEIVWVYFITAELLVSGVRAGKSRGVAFCDLHGRRHELGLKKKKMDSLGPLLRSAYPRATIGWSEEHRVAFERNPASLLRTTVSPH